MDLLQSFFGWAALVGGVVLSITSLILVVFRGWVVKIHQTMFNVSEGFLNEQYFGYLAYFKIGISVLFVIPYIALWFLNQ